MACSQLTMTLLLYLPMFMLSFIVVLVCGLLEWNFFSVVCLYLFPLESQLLTTNLFNIATFMWLSQAKTWISMLIIWILYWDFWLFFSWNACGKMQVTRPVQHKTNSTIKETIMYNAMRDKRAAIEIQIGVVQIMSVFCIVVVESLVVVNSRSVVTSCCVVFNSSNTSTYKCDRNLIKVQLLIYC